MNIITHKVKPVVRVGALVFLTSAALAISASADDIAPQFSVEATKVRVIKSGATAFENGDISKSIAFSKRALTQGLRKSRKSAAYSNLCAALGTQERYREAMKACDAALKLAPQNWQAFSNRAVVNWLSGETELARQDLQSAQSIAGDEPKITHNFTVLG